MSFVELPVSVVSNSSVCDSCSDSRKRSNEGKYFTSKHSKSETIVDRVVNKNGSLQHHKEVADCQVNNEHVGRGSKRLSPANQEDLLHNVILFIVNRNYL